MPWCASILDGLKDLDASLVFGDEAGIVFGKPSGGVAVIPIVDLSSGVTDFEREDIMRRAYHQKIIIRRNKK